MNYRGLPDVGGPQWRHVLRGRATHPVQHVRPALHGDALKHCQHRKQEVVKVGDSVVWTLPAFPALGAVDRALAPVP